VILAAKAGGAHRVRGPGGGRRRSGCAAGEGGPHRSQLRCASPGLENSKIFEPIRKIYIFAFLREVLLSIIRLKLLSILTFSAWHIFCSIETVYLLLQRDFPCQSFLSERMLEGLTRMSAPSKTHELIVEHMSMSYWSKEGSEVHALKDIHFTMRAGDLVVAVGPSGCGKTTLLSIVAGFLSPTQGSVILDGKRIDAPGPERGVVFQQGALFEWLTVYDNAAFGLKVRGVPEQERRKTVMDYLSLVGLTEFCNCPIYQLSGGMRQRVAIVRCLANDPSIILMDEPLGALDALTREKMQALILKIWKETGKMIFFITHSVEEAIYLASTLFVMSARPGQIMKRYDLSFLRDDRDARAVKSSPAFIKVREEVLSLIWGMEEQNTVACG
jgi:taurine transport system ATP-binding protein